MISEKDTWATPEQVINLIAEIRACATVHIALMDSQRSIAFQNNHQNDNSIDYEKVRKIFEKPYTRYWWHSVKKQEWTASIWVTRDTIAVLRSLQNL